MKKLIEPGIRRQLQDEVWPQLSAHPIYSLFWNTPESHLRHYLCHCVWEGMELNYD